MFWDESWTKEHIDRDEARPEYDLGECRRFPPCWQRGREGGDDYAWPLPKTERREWCGEYKPNKVIAS
jgi:hypothetical protein